LFRLHARSLAACIYTRQGQIDPTGTTSQRHAGFAGTGRSKGRVWKSIFWLLTLIFIPQPRHGFSRAGHNNA
jgi:hypothetical protein